MRFDFKKWRQPLTTLAVSVCAVFLTATAMSAPIAVPPPATPITGGITEVRLDAGPTLASLGVGVSTVGSATVVSAAGGIPIVDFPITGGSINALVNPAPGVPAAQIEHGGSGLALAGTAAGSPVLKLEDFLIDTQSLTLYGKVDAAGTILGSQIALFSISLSGDTTYPFGLALTQGAADALNGFFNVTAFTGGLAIGVASTTPSTVPEPGSLALLLLGVMGLTVLRRRLNVETLA